MKQKMLDQMADVTEAMINVFRVCGNRQLLHLGQSFHNLLGTGQSHSNSCLTDAQRLLNRLVAGNVGVHVFCTRILDTGPGSMRQIRNLMRNQFKVPLPKDPADGAYTWDQHRLAFTRFVEVIGANLSGQTGFRTDASWATQAQTIAGFATIQSPDLILREADLARTLPDLARWLGQSESVLPNAPEMDHPYQLADIYDAELEAQIASVYQRDYLLFGFGDWGA